MYWLCNDSSSFNEGFSVNALLSALWHSGDGSIVANRLDALPSSCTSAVAFAPDDGDIAGNSGFPFPPFGVFA